MDKMKCESPDLSQVNITRLAEIFPSVITEGRDENGKPKKGVNFEALRQLLSTDVLERDEAYEFSWPGKNAAIAEAARPIRKTLRPCPEESSNWDTTENLYIEGDNLVALKLLQENYLGKVRMIYIDPPYNTGNDFIYRDNFTASKQKYEELSGEMSKNGEGEKQRLFRNTDANGRFHSDWCSMIYPRLLLARNLLCDDGLIFISCDDNEQGNLRKICDEIFGEENFRNIIVIRRGAKSVQAQFETWDKLGQANEYILLYTKNPVYRFNKQFKQLSEAKCGGWNNHWRGTDRPTMRYELFGISPKSGQWRWSKERSLKAISNYKRMLKDVGKISSEITQIEIDQWYGNQNEAIDLLRISDKGKPEHYVPPSDETLLNSSWTDLLIGSSHEISQLFDKKIFDVPKLTAPIQRMLSFVDSDALILDFFSGSATTAQAVMQLNAEDGGKRRFIMVQLAEECAPDSEAARAGYGNICEIGKERIRRAGEKIKRENADKPGIANLDTGFRVFKCDSSNMKDVYYAPNHTTQARLDELISNIKEDRTDLDLFFGCVLEWGLPLNLPYKAEEVCGYTVHFYDNAQNPGDRATLAACFDANISEEAIREIARRNPLRAVFRDSSFASSQARINIGEIFKNLAPDTRLKVI